MKDSLLLLMTPNMSLKKWEARGQLSRELNFYDELVKRSNLKLIIYSYGRDDKRYIENYPDFTVLEMPNWIPRKIPFSIQNVIYHIFSLIKFREYFQRVLLAKTNQFRSARFGLLLKLVYQIPLVVRMGFYHSHFKKNSWMRQLEEKITFKKADRILTTSTEAAKFIEKRYSIQGNKILSMCNTIDLNRFKPMPLQKEYDLIFVGRLEKVKNIQLLLDIATKFNNKFLIIGRGSLDHLVKKALQQYNHIEWRERVDNAELPLYYNKSKCFILLSMYEGNPKVLLEAMACRLPAIGSEVPGIRECIKNGYSGALIDIQDNADNIKNNILEILNSQKQLDLMGENARAWVMSHCDPNKNIYREIDFYFQYLKEPGLSVSNLSNTIKD